MDPNQWAYSQPYGRLTHQGGSSVPPQLYEQALMDSLAQQQLAPGLSHSTLQHQSFPSLPGVGYGQGYHSAVPSYADTPSYNATLISSQANVYKSGTGVDSIPPHLFKASDEGIPTHLRPAGNTNQGSSKNWGLSNFMQSPPPNNNPLGVLPREALLNESLLKTRLPGLVQHASMPTSVQHPSGASGNNSYLFQQQAHMKDDSVRDFPYGSSRSPQQLNFPAQQRNHRPQHQSEWNTGDNLFLQQRSPPQQQVASPSTNQMFGSSAPPAQPITSSHMPQSISSYKTQGSGTIYGSGQDMEQSKSQEQGKFHFPTYGSPSSGYSSSNQSAAYASDGHSFVPQQQSNTTPSVSQHSQGTMPAENHQSANRAYQQNVPSGNLDTVRKEKERFSTLNLNDISANAVENITKQVSPEYAKGRKHKKSKKKSDDKHKRKDFAESKPVTKAALEEAAQDVSVPANIAVASNSITSVSEQETSAELKMHQKLSSEPLQKNGKESVKLQDDDGLDKIDSSKPESSSNKPKALPDETSSLDIKSPSPSMPVLEAANYPSMVSPDNNGDQERPTLQPEVNGLETESNSNDVPALSSKDVLEKAMMLGKENEAKYLPQVDDEFEGLRSGVESRPPAVQSKSHLNAFQDTFLSFVDGVKTPTLSQIHGTKRNAMSGRRSGRDSVAMSSTVVDKVKKTEDVSEREPSSKKRTSKRSKRKSGVDNKSDTETSVDLSDSSNSVLDEIIYGFPKQKKKKSKTSPTPPPEEPKPPVDSDDFEALIDISAAGKITAVGKKQHDDAKSKRQHNTNSDSNDDGEWAPTSKKPRQKSSRKKSHKQDDEPPPAPRRTRPERQCKKQAEAKRRKMMERKTNVKQVYSDDDFGSELSDSVEFVEFASDLREPEPESSDKDPGWTPVELKEKEDAKVEPAASDSEIESDGDLPRKRKQVGRQKKRKKSGPKRAAPSTTPATTTKPSAAKPVKYVEPEPVSKYKKGDFVVLKSDINTVDCPIWRVDSSNLLQKYQPYEERGKCLYKAISTYSGWGRNTEAGYQPVQVRCLRSNGSNPVILELLAEIRLADNELPPLTVQQNEALESHDMRDVFNIYTQVLLSQVLDPEFITEVKRENDDYFLDAMKVIDDVISDKIETLQGLVHWNTVEYQDALEEYPFFRQTPGDIPLEPCQACKVITRPATKYVNFSGETYNRDTLTIIKQADHIEFQKFHVCTLCAELTECFHSLMHIRFRLLRHCDVKIKSLKESNVSDDAREILESCLQNRTWVNQVFLELVSLLDKCEKKYS